jgi:hypothetical protein
MGFREYELAMTRCAWLALTFLITVLATPLLAQGADPVEGHPGESRLFLVSSGDSVQIVGWIRDLHSYEPLHHAMITFGTHGTLTNEDGWFRLALPAEAFPLDASIVKLGWGEVTLHLTANSTTERFFVQHLELTLGCERVRVAGAPPNEVLLHLRDVLTNGPVSGVGAIRLKRLDDGDVQDMAIPIVEGSLRLPISRHGVYEIGVEVPGFHRWRVPALPINVDVCDVRGLAGAEHIGWLVPTG